MNTETKDRAREQAQTQFDCIKSMVERLNHCNDCDDPECALTDQQIYNGLNMYYEGHVATKEEREQYHNREEATEYITGDALSVEVRSDWHTPGEDSEEGEYMILLCTGGPAVRIIGDLNGFKEPETTRLQYQDWGTLWEELILSHDDYETLLTYAQQFYFGN